MLPFVVLRTRVAGFYIFSTPERCTTACWNVEPLLGEGVQSAMPYLKAILAGLLASAISYLCFLTWLHMKAASLAEERGTEGLLGVTGSHAYVLHSPAFWAIAIIAFGVGFFLFLRSGSSS